MLTLGNDSQKSSGNLFITSNFSCFCAVFLKIIRQILMLIDLPHVS